ncbi:MAG: disulfide bond formation protein B [Reyranella sp.]|nr:disulfide bond formation protein B [Reyranella sp.]
MAASQRLPLPSLIGLLAALGSTGMLGGALYFQYLLGLAPCEMCHWQRWPHIASIVVGLLAFTSFARPGLAATFAGLAVAALAVTSAIGLIHAGVELHWWQGPQTCTGTIPRGLSADELKKYLFGARMVRCDDIVWSLWGISMAGWNAVLSGVLALALGFGLAGGAGVVRR